jgi:hypothetical protein
MDKLPWEFKEKQLLESKDKLLQESKDRQSIKDYKEKRIEHAI